MQPTQEEINNIINEYDLDGDGHIDFSEYKEIYKAYRLSQLGEDRSLRNRIFLMLFDSSIGIIQDCSIRPRSTQLLKKWAWCLPWRK